MAFILTSKRGESVTINAWNWRPTIALLLDAKLIDNETHERLGTHGCRGEIDEETARGIADFIESKLKNMKPGDRIRYDLTVTGEPQELAVFSPDGTPPKVDPVDIYSSKYEWLVTFRDFCQTSGGFVVG
jgi:hypothetical protein